MAKVNRRTLIQASLAVPAAIATRGMVRLGEASEWQLPSGWQTLPLGGGGYVSGIDIVNPTGEKACKTDVFGAYVLDGSRWRQVCSLEGFGPGASVTNGDLGVWEIKRAPSLPTRLYMLFSDVAGSSGIANGAHYYIYRSDDGGRHWKKTSPAFSTSKPGHYRGFTLNGFSWRLSNQKIAIDPNNPDIVYVSAVAGSWSGATGVHCTFDGGTTWTKVSSIPDPGELPGACGILFDPSKGTVTVDGQRRTARLIVPVQQQGVYETINGGVSFAKVIGDPTPSTTVRYTTTGPNRVLIAHILCSGLNTVKNVTTAGLAWHYRAGPTFDPYFNVRLYSYYAIAPAAGTFDIEVNYNDGCVDVWPGPALKSGNRVGVFAVAGANTASKDTVFDGAPALSAGVGLGGQIPSKATTVKNAMVVMFTSSGQTTPDSGYAFLNQNTADVFYSEYKIEPSPGSFSPGTPNTAQTYGVIADAIKPITLLTIDGVPQYATSLPATQSGPANIWSAQINADGDYWCVNNNTGLVNGSIWRWRSGGSFERIDGVASRGFAPIPAGTPPKRSGGIAICVDPRPTHKGNVVFSGPHNTFYGWQTTNGNAATPALIAWNGTAGGKRPKRSGDVPWLEHVSWPAMGDMMIDPTDGTYWCADGVSVWQGPADNNYSLLGYNIRQDYKTAGIEELVAQDVIWPPGATQPICIVQDRAIIRANLPNYPTTYYKAGYQSNAWQGDFAWNQPNYAAVLIFGGIPPLYYSSYSIDHGITWTPFAQVPTSIAGGCIAVSWYTSPTSASIVVIGGGQGVPRYTTNNGVTWSDSTGAPATSYIRFSQLRSRLLTACRDTPDKYFLYAPGFGIYGSTNGGATWRQISAFQTMTNGNGNGQILMNVPGYSDHLLLANIQDGRPENVLNLSTDGGAKFATINAGITGVTLFSLGKIAPGATYPTIFVLGKYRGVHGFWRSVDRGNTWTSFGKMETLPVTHQMDSALCMCGDWNEPFRVVIGFNSSSFALFNP